MCSNWALWTVAQGCLSSDLLCTKFLIISNKIYLYTAIPSDKLSHCGYYQWEKADTLLQSLSRRGWSCYVGKNKWKNPVGKHVCSHLYGILCFIWSFLACFNLTISKKLSQDYWQMVYMRSICFPIAPWCMLWNLHWLVLWCCCGLLLFVRPLVRTPH